MLHVEDKTLILPDGRTLAYANNGNTSSHTIVLYFHGGLSVGDASRVPPVLLEKHIHYVAPSLPGHGRSSPVPSPISYATTLAADMTALIAHLYPRTSALKLYICGHSFGTLAAQMLFGLPRDIFPLGRQIAGLVLLAPASPPHLHQDYTKTMSWLTYFKSGPPARYVPFNIIPRLLKIVLARKIYSESSAEAFVRKTMEDTMDEAERETFARWREENDLEEGQFEREMGRNVAASVAQTWQGYVDATLVYHFGWGESRLQQPTDDHTTPHVMIVYSENDNILPRAMAEWLAHNHKHGILKVIGGSHFSALFHLNDIWKEIME